LPSSPPAFAATPSVGAPRRRLSRASRQALLAYLLIVPAMAFVFGILGYGVVRAFITSLHQVNMLMVDQPFVGLRNYIELLSNPRFVNSFQRSLVFVGASVTLGTLLAVFVALSIYRLKRFKGTVQALILIPYMVSGISTAVSWRFMFTGTGSLANIVLDLFGAGPISWLGDPNRAMAVVVLANVWMITPFSVLIVVAGLEALDPQLFDAAAVDGASGFSLFRFLTLPLIAPMMGVSFIWLSFASFNMFDIILATTGGGPGNATDLMAVYLYRLAFQRLDFSGASAVMIMLLIINVSVSILSLRLSRT